MNSFTSVCALASYAALSAHVSRGLRIWLSTPGTETVQYRWSVYARTFTPASETVVDEVVTTDRQVGPISVTGDGPLVVREKTHPADPMTLDQALYEMELVGHDFYLFVDKESERPAVVYRRRGYDYGVISLELGATL